MKINFTKKEYNTLIEVVDLALWVINSHRTESFDGEQAYLDLRHKVYSFYKDFDASDKIEYDKGSNEYFETRTFEESQHRNLLHEFEQENFWAMLINLLSERDAIRKVGKSTYQRFPIEKKMALIDAMEEQWGSEFAKQGLERLNV